MAVVALVLSGATFRVVRAADDATVEKYTGPPIFLDEPPTPPPAALVEKRVDKDEYPDGKVRYEREIARYSDDSFVADGFYREFYPNGQKFCEGQYRNGHREGTWTFWHDNGTQQRAGDLQKWSAGRQLGSP